MPELISEQTVTFEMSDLLSRVPLERPRTPPTRAPGMHQSDILAYVARQIGILKPEERDEEEYPLIWALGQAWEEWAASLYPQMIWQPGELVKDGIAVNCDGISLTHDYPTQPVYAPDGEYMIWEYKSTFKGVLTGDEFLKDKKTWMWLHQGRAYCHVYGAAIEQWHVCHLRGDYKAFGPIYKVYTVRFTERECGQTWDMLLNNKEAAMQALIRTAARPALPVVLPG